LYNKNNSQIKSSNNSNLKSVSSTPILNLDNDDENEITKKIIVPPKNKFFI